MSCGVVESLLREIEQPSPELEQMSFATKAVKIMGLLISFDVETSQLNNCIKTITSRFNMEVDLSRLEETCSRNKNKIPGSELIDKCPPQRALLLVYSLKFLHKIITSHAQNIMEESFLESLKHIVSRSYFYDSSLFFLVIEILYIHDIVVPEKLTVPPAEKRAVNMKLNKLMK